MYSKSRITQTAATIAAIMGIEVPHSAEEANDIIVKKALAALPEGVSAYDRVLMYNPDAAMHKNAPEHELSLAALQKNSNDFAARVDEVSTAWAGHNIFYGFCPDHGCHEIDGGAGSHGLDMDEDMNIIHMYGWQ